MSRNVTVAAIQMASGSWSISDNIATAERLIRVAAQQGAQLAVCPELFTMPYFCSEQHYAHIELAQSANNNACIQRFAALAKELNIVIPIGFYERANNASFNSVAVADADGSVLGVYRKTHIPDGPGYNEKFYFTPGDTGFCVWNTKIGRIGIGICWDQWYPETARILALKGAELLCFPTIIGNEPHTPELDTSAHWQRTMQGHAAANMVPVIAANRIGSETAKHAPRDRATTMTFYGSSFIADETGDKKIEANRHDESVLTHTFDLDAVYERRRAFGFFRDRRPNMYHTLMTSDGNQSCYR